MVAVTLTVAGCATAEGGSPPPRTVSVAEEEVEPWRQAAAPGDVAKLEAMAHRWPAKHGAPSRMQGPLVDPAAALPHAAPAPGPYRCRLTRIGQRAQAGSAWTFCFVGGEGEQLSITADVPGRRVGGYLWRADGGKRYAFLGGVIPARGKPPAAYGEAAASDAVGWLERIGEFRYRLALPVASPSGLDLIELVAAPRP